MAHYAAIVSKAAGRDIARFPGAGAAGGLGAALKVFLHAEMRSGIETVLNLIDFDDLLTGADLVVTGEGAALEMAAGGASTKSFDSSAFTGKGVFDLSAATGLNHHTRNRFI